MRTWSLIVAAAFVGCIEERSLFVPEIHEGQRARGALLAVEREGAQTLLALDLENQSGDPGLVEPYLEGDLTNLFLFTNTPAELFWPTGAIPLAATQAWPVPTPLLAQYCGRVDDEGLSLGDCGPSLELEPRLPLPDVAACLRADRCVVGEGTEARCLPCEPSPVTTAEPPAEPTPLAGPCAEGWAATGPLDLCRTTWSPVPQCATRYTAALGCLPALPTCPTSTSTLGPGDPWRAAIEDGPPGVVWLGPGTYSAASRLILPPGREVRGACGATILELPQGAVVDRAGAPRSLDHLAVALGAGLRVEDGQTLNLNAVELRPAGSAFALEVQSATVALVDVDFRPSANAALARGHGASIRAEGLSAHGGAVIFDLNAASRLVVTRSVVIGANRVISNADGDTFVSDSHFSGFVAAGVVIGGGSLRLYRSELIGEEQFAVTTSSNTSELEALYIATRGDGGDPLVVLGGLRGEIRGSELVARKGEGLVLTGGELQVADVWITGGLNGVAAMGESLQANLQRLHVEDSEAAITINGGADVKLSDLRASTRCEGLSSISASRTELNRGELLLSEAGDGCEGPVLGVNLDRGARLIARDLRITGAAKGLVSRGNELEAPQFDGERIELLDNALDLELAAGRVTLRRLSVEICSRWPACAGLFLGPLLGRDAELDVETFSLRDRSPAFEIDGGALRIKDGQLELCPNEVAVSGVAVGPVPELLLERVRLLACEP